MTAAPGPGQLFIVVGLPAAGKSTGARSLAPRRGAVRLNADESMTGGSACSTRRYVTASSSA